MLTKENFKPSCQAAMKDTENVLDQAMDNLYEKTDLSKEDIEKIRQDFWLNHNRVFGGRDE